MRALTEAGERPLAERVDRRPRRRSSRSCARSGTARVAERLPHLVSIFGPAGRRQVDRSPPSFAAVAAEAGARVVRGRSLPVPRERDVRRARDAADAALRRLRERRRGGDRRASCARADGASCSRTRTPTPSASPATSASIVGVDAGSEAADRDALFSSVREFLEAAAREQPTILVFEDIHWADPNLLDLIEALATRVHGLPLLLVTLARPELLDTRAGVGSGLSELHGADARAARRGTMRASSRSGGSATATASTRWSEIAEGNPLFIEQLAATSARPRPGTLPTSIRGIVAARLDALPARGARAAARRRRRRQGLLARRAARVEPATPATSTRLLDELERRDLVRREPASIIEGEQQFAFTHVLIRDVAYDLLPRADRARRHAARRRVLRAARRARPARRSARSRGTGATPATTSAPSSSSLRAAEQAERGWAKDHAAFLYREALELVPAGRRRAKSALRRRLAIASTASFHADGCQTAGKSAGVTSPTISSSESILCCPSRVECSRTISSFGAS